MHGPPNDPTSTHDALKTALEAVVKEWPPGLDPVTILQITYTKDEFIMKLAEVFAPYAQVEQDKHTLDNSMAVRTKAHPSAHAFIEAFYSLLAANLGKGNAKLRDFGATPFKARAVPTVEKQAVANQKRLATRTARHTMGKKQKQQIHGTVTPPADPTGKKT